MEIVAIKGTNGSTAPSGWFVDRKLSGGGALLDHIVHVMDLMRWITGSEPEEDYAYAANLFDETIDVDDAGMIHVKFENGAFGVVDTSWSRNQRPSEVHMALHMKQCLPVLFEQKEELLLLENDM